MSHADYTVSIGKPALQALKNLPNKDKQIALKIFALQSNPKPQDCKPLKGYPGGYRVTQGEYRILYTIEEQEVRVFPVGKRNDGEVYRNL